MSRSLGAALMLVSATAFANNVTINTGNIKYRNTEVNRPGGSQYQSYISYNDCVRGAWYVEVPVTVTNGVGTLQLWAAETDNCATDISRNNNTGGTGTSSGQCVSLPLTSSSQYIYKVTVTDVMRALGVGADCVDHSGQSAARTVTLYFLLAGSTESTAGTIDATNIATLPIKVDLVGPVAPTGLSLHPEDGKLSIDVPKTVDADTKGYYVYIDPLPSDKVADKTDAGGPLCAEGTGGTGGSTGSTTSSTSTSTTTTSAAAGGAGGGVGGAGGAGTTTTTSTTTGATTGGAGGAGGSGSSSACASGVTIPCVDPAHPSYNAKSRYDIQVTAPSSGIVLEGLENGTTYTVGIAAFDAVNNIGPLSVLQCGSPEPTDTYMKQYCSDGGSACVGGCGSCEIGGVAELAWPSLLASAVAAAGLAARRRRRAQRRDAVESE